MTTRGLALLLATATATATALLAGCSSVAPTSSAKPGSAGTTPGSSVPQASAPSTSTASGQPKTLAAATAVEQEYVDRYTSGDREGAYLLLSAATRSALPEAEPESTGRVFPGQF